MNRSWMVNGTSPLRPSREHNHLYNHTLFPLRSLNHLQPPNAPKVAYIAQMLTATHVQSIPVKETLSAVSTYAEIAAREHQHQQRLCRNLEHDAQFGRAGPNHVLIVLQVYDEVETLLYVTQHPEILVIGVLVYRMFDGDPQRLAYSP